MEIKRLFLLDAKDPCDQAEASQIRNIVNTVCKNDLCILPHWFQVDFGRVQNVIIQDPGALGPDFGKKANFLRMRAKINVLKNYDFTHFYKIRTDLNFDMTTFCDHIKIFESSKKEYLSYFQNIPFYHPYFPDLIYGGTTSAAVRLTDGIAFITESQLKNAISVENLLGDVMLNNVERIVSQRAADHNLRSQVFLRHRKEIDLQNKRLRIKNRWNDLFFKHGDAKRPLKWELTRGVALSFHMLTGKML